MKQTVLGLLLVGLGIGVLGCQLEPPAAMTAPAVEFGTGQVQIVSSADTFVLRVEIAETRQQMQVGLTQRPELPADQGMIFLFEEEQPPGSGFWMYRVFIPLSIAFLDAEGFIREIQDMQPCPRRFSWQCPSYEAAVPYHAALEVNQGYFARRDIGVGDRVVLRRDERDAEGAAERDSLPSHAAEGECSASMAFGVECD